MSKNSRKRKATFALSNSDEDVAPSTSTPNDKRMSVSEYFRKKEIEQPSTSHSLVVSRVKRRNSTDKKPERKRTSFEFVDLGAESDGDYPSPNSESHLSISSPKVEFNFNSSNDESDNLIGNETNYTESAPTVSVNCDSGFSDETNQNLFSSDVVSDIQSDLIESVEISDDDLFNTVHSPVTSKKSNLKCINPVHKYADHSQPKTVDVTAGGSSSSAKCLDFGSQYEENEMEPSAAKLLEDADLSVLSQVNLPNVFYSNSDQSDTLNDLVKKHLNSSETTLQCWAKCYEADNKAKMLLERIDAYKKSFNDLSKINSNFNHKQSGWNETALRELRDIVFNIEYVLQQELKKTSLTRIEHVYLKDKVSAIHKIVLEVNEIGKLIAEEKKFVESINMLVKNRIKNELSSLQKKIASVKYHVKPIRDSLAMLHDINVKKLK